VEGRKREWCLGVEGDIIMWEGGRVIKGWLEKSIKGERGW
jgi:hypothetical protein